MKRADAAVGANHHVRRLAEQVAAAAIAPIVVGDQAEKLEHFHVGIDSAARAGLGGVLAREGSARSGVPEFESTFDAGDFKVNARGGIESDLGDEIGVHVGNGLSDLVVELDRKSTRLN